jgi:hypothetical protein
MKTTALLPLAKISPHEKNRGVTSFLPLLLAFETLVGGGCCCLEPDASIAWQSHTQPYYVSASELAGTLTGPWVHNDCPTTISVAPDGRSLTIIDEFGHQNTGYIAGNRELIVPSSGIRGHVGYGALHITWSNGSIWARPSAPWYAAVFP